MKRRVTNPKVSEITGIEEMIRERNEAQLEIRREALAILEQSGDIAESDENEFPDGAVVPLNLRIVSQTVRYDDLGNQFVDVTFEWDPVPGYTGNYKLRVGSA